MFAVLFEVQPKPDQWETYLGYARALRPELEQIDGFIDNTRYASLARPGWILSLSSWRDEKALVRWRTRATHHDVQEKGRAGVLLDYHLRVGQLTRDSRMPDGQSLKEQRLDETEVGEGTTVALIDARCDPRWLERQSPEAVARWLGLLPNADDLVSWDVYDAVLTPGDVILMSTWRNQSAAQQFEAMAAPPSDARQRRVRIVRDYAMFDRREAPQFYPDVPRD